MDDQSLQISVINLREMFDEVFYGEHEDRFQFLFLEFVDSIEFIVESDIRFKEDIFAVKKVDILLFGF